MKRCRRCNAPLASDHQDDDWCSPCLRSMRDYDPKEDPRFLAKLLECLAQRPGELVEPLKALGIGYEHRNAVKAGVRALRRRGYDIRATQRTAGYRYVGYVVTAQVEIEFTSTACAAR